MITTLIAILLILLALNGLVVWWVVYHLMSSLVGVQELIMYHEMFIKQLQSQIKQLNVKLKK